MKHSLTLALFIVAGALLTAPTAGQAQQMDPDAKQHENAARSCPGYPGPGAMQGHGMMMGPGMMGMMHRGMMGPGMMRSGHMMGPGMMHQGGGMRGGMMQIRPSLELTAADVETMLNSHLAWRGVEDYAVGSVSRENDYIIAVEIVDADDEVVRRYEVNRQTGAVRPARDQ